MCREASETVLIVDNDELFLLSLVESLQRRMPRCRILKAADGREALDILAATTVQLVVTDLVMPVMDGLELISRVGRDHPGVHTIVMTGMTNLELRKHLRALGTLECFEKPIDLESLSAAIDQNLAVERVVHGSF